MSISTGIYVATALFLAIGSNPAQSAQPSILKYGTVDGWTVQTNGWLCQAAAFHKAANILLVFIAWADPENGERLWTLFLKNDDDHTTTRARPVSTTPTSSDGASANRSKRKKVGSLLDADPGSRSDAD
jgi:hypothetical protein